MLWQFEVRSRADFEAKFRRLPTTLPPMRAAESGALLTFPKTPAPRVALLLVEQVLD